MDHSVSPVKQLIGRFESTTNLHFKPSTTFYQSLGIGRVRLSKLSKGKRNPDSEEIKKLVEYFGQFFPVKVEDLL